MLTHIYVKTWAGVGRSAMVEVWLMGIDDREQADGEEVIVGAS